MSSISMQRSKLYSNQQYPTIYQELKARQLQYISIIRQLYQENKKLKAILKDINKENNENLTVFHNNDLMNNQNWNTYPIVAKQYDSKFNKIECKSFQQNITQIDNRYMDRNYPNCCSPKDGMQRKSPKIIQLGNHKSVIRDNNYPPKYPNQRNKSPPQAIHRVSPGPRIEQINNYHCQQKIISKPIINKNIKNIQFVNPMQYSPKQIMTTRKPKDGHFIISQHPQKLQQTHIHFRKQEQNLRQSQKNRIIEQPIHLKETSINNLSKIPYQDNQKQKIQQRNNEKNDNQNNHSQDKQDHKDQKQNGNEHNNSQDYQQNQSMIIKLQDLNQQKSHNSMNTNKQVIIQNLKLQKNIPQKKLQETFRERQQKIEPVLNLQRISSQGNYQNQSQSEHLDNHMQKSKDISKSSTNNNNRNNLYQNNLIHSPNAKMAASMAYRLQYGYVPGRQLSPSSPKDFTSLKSSKKRIRITNNIYM